VTQHVWKKRWLKENDPEMSRHILICERCGTWVEESLPGIPNLNGAVEVERDCDLAVVRKIMLS